MKPKVLAIISARGGSKGVPRKNIRQLSGKPLIAWTIEEAKKSKYITKLIVSSEDNEIIDVSRELGCEVPFIRPLSLSQDESLGIDVILHAIEQCPEYDYVVSLQPTSPLRTVQDIDGCIEFMWKQEKNFCVSVKEVSESPYWMYKVNNERKLEQLVKQDHMPMRRQELEKVYILNGAVYVAKIDQLLLKKTFLTESTLGYIMPEERSHDIDTELDFISCEYLMNKRIMSN